MKRKPTKFMKVSKIDKEIDDLLSTLRYKDPAGDDYKKIVANIEDLYRIKNLKREKFVSPDTLAVCACNIIGIVLILKHEQIGVITSKAINFIMKGRV